MRRGKPLTRRIPLRAVTGLIRATPLRRQPAVRPVGGRTADPVGRETRQAVKRRSGGRCEIGVMGCTGRGTDWAHRKRRAEGDHRVVNGLWACRECHSWTHANPALAKAAGWIVPPWADPAQVPVVLRCRRSVLLLADGGYGEALGGAA